MKTTGRCIVIYLLAMFNIAFFMAIVLPTDVPPPGADPLPTRAVAGQILAIYGLPLVIVLFYLKRTRIKSTES